MNKYKPLTKEQMIETAHALIALANGEEVQYYSEINGWSDCPTVDTEFPHRPKPKENFAVSVPTIEQATVGAIRDAEAYHQEQSQPTVSSAATKGQPTVSTDVNDY